MPTLHEVRDRLRRQARRLDRLTAAAPGDRLDRYRADPALLMADAGMPPDPWQAALLRSAARRVLMLTTRQAGKSTAAGFLALREALLTPAATVLLAAPSLRQAAELFRRVADAFTRLGRPVGVRAESVLRVEFANGSRVISVPAAEGNIRGFTARMVILDEAARIPDPLVAAVRPMLATTGGTLVCLSTAFAKSGFFYEQWVGPEGWERVRVTARECPRISPAFLAEELRALGPRLYAMEYACEFGDDVAAVFRSADVDAAVSPAVAPLFGDPAAPEGDPGAAAGLEPLFGGFAP